MAALATARERRSDRLFHAAGVGKNLLEECMKRFTLEVPTEGDTHVVNLSPELARRMREISGEGVLHIFVVGSTAGITTIEYEPGLVKHDFAEMMEKLAPANGKYDHEATWNDDNGHAHLRASVVGASVTIPFGNGKLLTGEYQQIVLVDFDTRPRKRTVIVTVL
jgi:secondary thiamine-phosphate synthase enzyme